MKIFFEKICIPPDTNLLEAMSVIDKGSQQLALVVNSKKVLLGIITDGDIRRALLRNISLKDSVDKLMNKEYKYIFENINDKDAFNFF